MEENLVQLFHSCWGFAMAMTVEQTTQLIQLILNSALMMAIALVWWGVVWLRHSAVVAQLQGHQRRTACFIAAGSLDAEQLAYLKHQRIYLQARFRLTRHGVLVMHGVLVALVGSLFGLSLRTLFGSNWLIPLSLVLFVVGIGGLLLSVLLTLMEFYQLGLLEEGKFHRSRPRPFPVASLPATVNPPMGEEVTTQFAERVTL